jgi:hypothetical protein
MAQADIDDLNRDRLAAKEPEVAGEPDLTDLCPVVPHPMPDNTAAQAAPQLADPEPQAQPVERAPCQNLTHGL